MNNDIFSQAPYRCRLDWGVPGVRRAAERHDIIVLVDVLSFSTTVAQAVEQGAVVHSCGEGDDVRTLTAELKAELAVARDRVPADGRFSLSPSTFDGVAVGTRVLLPSLNGGACSQCSGSAPHIFAGALVNADAVAGAVTSLLDGSQLNVTVIACGERDGADPTSSEGAFRVAIEDYLGAGSILSRIPFSHSPEAYLCASAFVKSRSRIGDLIWDCASGRELREAGFDGDVKFAARLGVLDVVPSLTGGAWGRFSL